MLGDSGADADSVLPACLIFCLLTVGPLAALGWALRVGRRFILQDVHGQGPGFRIQGPKTRIQGLGSGVGVGLVVHVCLGLLEGFM
jgi:hypothetical protein